MMIRQYWYKLCKKKPKVGQWSWTVWKARTTYKSTIPSRCLPARSNDFTCQVVLVNPSVKIDLTSASTTLVCLDSRVRDRGLQVPVEVTDQTIQRTAFPLTCDASVRTQPVSCMWRTQPTSYPTHFMASMNRCMILNSSIMAGRSASKGC